MFGMKKMLVAGAMVAMGMAVAGTAAAQTIVMPKGAVFLKGSVVVDNTGATGQIPNFTCDVLMLARLGEATPAPGNSPVERITGVQILNGGQGFLNGAACPFVDVVGLPWAVTVAGGNITIAGVGFAVHPDFGQPGCAPTNVVAAWQDGDPLQSDPISGAVVTMVNENVGGCLLNGTLKIHSYLAGPTS